MKKALINSLEPGRVCEIVEVGSEFEVAESFSWVDCSDDVNTSHTYNAETSEFIPYNLLANQGFIDNAYIVARGIAYTSIGNQLDMLYKELQATGTIALDGPWATHITAVKAAIPKDDIAAVIAWNEQHALNITPPAV